MKTHSSTTPKNPSENPTLFAKFSNAVVIEELVEHLVVVEALGRRRKSRRVMHVVDIGVSAEVFLWTVNFNVFRVARLSSVPP